MGKEIYAGLYLVVASILAIFFFRTLAKKNELGRRLSRVLGTGLVAMVAYIIYLSSNRYFLMSLANSVVFASIDWMLFFLAQFIYVYIENGYEKSMVNRFVPIVLALDNLHLLWNPVNEISIGYELVVQGANHYLVYKPKLLFNIHLGMCYVMVATIIITLIIKAARVPRLYRIRYVAVLLSFITVILLNALFLVVGGLIDFSILSYVMLGWFIYFYVFEFKGVQAANATKAYFIEEMNNPMILFNYQSKMLMNNKRAREIFNLSDDITEQEFRELNPYLEELGSHGRSEMEATVTLLDRVYYFRIQYNYLEDKKGRKIGTIYVFDDISEKKKAQIQTQFNADHDMLTGTYNRHYIYQLKQDLEKGNRFPVFGALYNVDHLRRINENYGVKVGDKVVCRLAWFLQQYSGVLDYVVRMDGDEMLLLIVGTTQKKAQDVFKKIEKRVDDFEVEDISVSSQYAYFTLDRVEDFDKIYEDARYEIAVKKGKIRQQDAKNQ